MNNLSIRHWELDDIESIISYFHNASNDYLINLGADPKKIPNRVKWKNSLIIEYQKPIKKTKYYYTIWEYNNQAIGHCNINKIVFGKEAYMHLHIWNPNPKLRDKGLGESLLKMSIESFFDKFQLKELYCEPRAANKAPHKVLSKVGFKYLKTCEIVPGPINYLQEVKRYRLTNFNIGSDI